MVCCTKLDVVALQGQQTCLRTVVQLPCVALETHLPRADPSVDLVSQVWGFSHSASQIGEGGCLAHSCPVAFKTILVAGARGTGMHMVSVLLSEVVRPNVPKTSTKTAIILWLTCCVTVVFSVARAIR